MSLTVKADPGAGTETVETKGSRLTVDPAQGAYELSRSVPEWRLAGSIGRPLQKVISREGEDAIGGYRELAFDWSDQGAMSGSIRLYADKPLALFSITSHAAMSKPAAAFPRFTEFPKDLHLFSYGDDHFAPPSFKAQQNGTPWLLFDDAGHALVISPASNFLVAAMQGDGKSSIASGFVAPLSNVPAEFTQRTLIAFGDGINAAWDAWGQGMTDLSGKHRPANDADVGLKCLGYWTDNGAAYYYNYDPDKGYPGTLLAVRDEMKRLGVPIRYMQLDSWWYSKTTNNPKGKPGGEMKNKDLPRGEWNRYGGLLEYTAHKDLFPDGLAMFQQKLGLPLITHNRWIDRTSPYHQKYKISGVAAIGPKWWNDIADYLKESGVVTYEQDWLNEIYANSPEMQSTVGVGDAFTDNMARACRERGITMQYCMATPRFYLEGSRYDNLTTVRVSDDRFRPKEWDRFLYVSRMASALGEWPWVDVFKSRETPHVLLATLSAGMVGISDALGETDVANVMRSVRSDGVIVKPDTAIVPTDRSFLADASGADEPMIAAAHSDHGRLRVLYVFAYPRNRQQKQRGVHFRPADLGISGDAAVYDWSSHRLTRVAAGEEYGADAFSDAMGDRPWTYCIVAPITRSGIALLGDAGKFASAGKQRIESIEESADGKSIKAAVVFATGEEQVTLYGYSPKPPAVLAGDAKLIGQEFDPASGHFQVHIAPLPGKARATVELSQNG